MRTAFFSGFIILTSLILGALPLQAGSSDYLERLRQHPAVLELEQEAQRYELEAAGAQGLPDPMFTVGVNNVPVTTPTQFDRFLPSNKMLGVSQKIPSPSARDRRSDSLKNQARLARLKATVRLADLQKEVRSAWVQKKKIVEMREALRWQLKLIDQLENWLTGKIEAGASVFGRFSELDVQREQIQEQITALDGEEMVLKADLERLIGEDPVVDAPNVVVKPWHGDDSRFWEVQVTQGEMDVNRAVEK
ncbi:MAG: TolC family protein [Magnetococcus sp. THC-1_WYH]